MCMCACTANETVVENRLLTVETCRRNLDGIYVLHVATSYLRTKLESTLVFTRGIR